MNRLGKEKEEGGGGSMMVREFRKGKGRQYGRKVSHQYEAIYRDVVL